jgi:ABC-type multidrug transport system ATPase subunit
MAQSQKPGIIILKRSKGGARALDNLTVSCEAGNVLCLLGHNGVNNERQ